MRSCLRILLLVSFFFFFLILPKKVLASSISGITQEDWHSMGYICLTDPFFPEGQYLTHVNTTVNGTNTGDFDRIYYYVKYQDGDSAPQNAVLIDYGGGNKWWKYPETDPSMLNQMLPLPVNGLNKNAVSTRTFRAVLFNTTTGSIISSMDVNHRLDRRPPYYTSSFPAGQRSGSSQYLRTITSGSYTPSGTIGTPVTIEVASAGDDPSPSRVDRIDIWVAYLSGDNPPQYNGINCPPSPSYGAPYPNGTCNPYACSSFQPGTGSAWYIGSVGAGGGSVTWNTNGFVAGTRAVVANIFDNTGYSLGFNFLTYTGNGQNDYHARVDYTLNSAGGSTPPPPAGKTCSVAASSSVTVGTAVNASYNGQGTAASEPVNLWLESQSGGAINPVPPNIGVYTDAGAGKTYYKLATCNSNSGSSCNGSWSNTLPEGNYYFHCDVPTDPNKCTGNPFCTPPVGSGTIDCSGWVSCSTTDVTPTGVDPAGGGYVPTSCNLTMTPGSLGPLSPGSTTNLRAQMTNILPLGATFYAIGFNSSDANIADVELYGHDGVRTCYYSTPCPNPTNTTVTAKSPAVTSSTTINVYGTVKSSGTLYDWSCYTEVPVTVTGSGSPMTCSSATLSPNPMNLSIGGSSQDLWVVAINGLSGSVGQVDFSTSPTGVVTLNPTTDSSSPYSTTVSPSSQGSTTARASVKDTGGTERCYGTSTINVSSVPWFQTQGGNVHAFGDILSSIPSTVPAASRYFSLDLNSYPGLVSYYGGLSANFGQGTASTKGWLANSAFYPAKSSYDYFYQKLGSPVDNFKNGSSQRYCDEVACPTPAGTTIYYVNGDLNMRDNSNWAVPATSKIVVLVNGNLSINLPANRKITVANGGFLALIANGNITINGNIGDKSATPTTYLEGIYLADGTLDTYEPDPSGGDFGGALGSGFRLVSGGLFAAQSGVRLQRDVKGDCTAPNICNSNTPAELFIFRPDLVVNAPRELWSSKISWMEVAP